MKSAQIESPRDKRISTSHVSFGKTRSEIRGMATRRTNNSQFITNASPAIQNKLDKSCIRHSMNFGAQFKLPSTEQWEDAYTRPQPTLTTA